MHDSKLLIIKIGGGSGLNLEGIITDLTELNVPTIIVHGANALRDEMASAMGVERRTITSLKGYTSVFSGPAMLDVMMAAYSGVRNKRIVELCQQHGINAVGLSGLDGRVVQGRRNPGIRTMQDGKKVLLRDFSGKPRSVNVSLLTSLLRQGYTPVLTAPIVDENGVAINMENDDVVTVLARDLDARQIISFIEAPGLLQNADDESSVIPHVDPQQLESIETAVDGRMRRKIKAIRTLFSEGHRPDVQVVLADGRVEHPLRDALAGAGTKFMTTGAHAPVSSSADTRELQDKFELDVYGKRGIVLVSGIGAHVWDDTGKKYIDCIAGHGAVNIGHRHPRVAEAIAEQTSTLGACPGAFYNSAKAQYLQALVTAAPANLTRAFLCNSGTEAVEAAMKFARLHTQRAGIVAMQGGFHGRTFGAMSAGNAKLATPFQPLLPGISHVRFNDVSQLEESVTKETAAVLLELVQGEGGVHPVDPAYIAAARDICDANGTLLIIDEVQTGFGRTGRLFACERFDIRPDLLCLAKGIANGAFPMGAVVADDHIKVPVGLHGSTFGGHPVACAAASATLNALTTNGVLPDVTRKGDELVERIRASKAPLVREVRHVGLMIGLELKTRVRPILTALAQRGVLALPAGTKVLRLLPPLTIDDEDLRVVADAVVDSCGIPTNVS